MQNPSKPVMSLTPTQINVSSIGDTYTDVSGNTFAETSNQTRLLMASYVRTVNMIISGHVNAGTGSFRSFNFTDSAILGTSTTTSVTSVKLTLVSSALATNKNDYITLLVANSGAGNTVTIDEGGIIAADGFGSNGFSSLLNITTTTTGGGGYYKSLSYGLLKQTTGATCTIQPMTGIITSTINNPGFNIDVPFGTAQANTVFSMTPNVRITTGVSHIIASVTAISGTYALAMSYEINSELV